MVRDYSPVQSYNNLLDRVLRSEFNDITFAIIKHNNACGIASSKDVSSSLC